MKKTTKFQYLFFKLSDENFAIHVSNIEEVLEIKKITEIPQAADFIKGVTNFRGDILAVIDTHKKLKIENTSEESIIIILKLSQNNKSFLVGVTANSVSKVSFVDKSAIQTVSNISSKIKKEYLDGIITIEDTVTQIINANITFSLAELTELELTEETE